MAWTNIILISKTDGSDGITVRRSDNRSCYVIYKCDCLLSFVCICWVDCRKINFGKLNMHCSNHRLRKSDRNIEMSMWHGSRNAVHALLLQNAFALNLKFKCVWFYRAILKRSDFWSPYLCRCEISSSHWEPDLTIMLKHLFNKIIKKCSYWLCGQTSTIISKNCAKVVLQAKKCTVICLWYYDLNNVKTLLK